MIGSSPIRSESVRESHLANRNMKRTSGGTRIEIVQQIINETKSSLASYADTTGQAFAIAAGSYTSCELSLPEAQTAYDGVTTAPFTLTIAEAGFYELLFEATITANANLEGHIAAIRVNGRDAAYEICDDDVSVFKKMFLKEDAEIKLVIRANNKTASSQNLDIENAFFQMVKTQ